MGETVSTAMYPFCQETDVKPGQSVLRNVGYECRNVTEEKEKFFKMWHDYIHDLAHHKPPGLKVMAFCWTDSRRTGGFMIFDSHESLENFKAGPEKEFNETIFPLLLDGPAPLFDEACTLWKTKSRKHMIDGMNFIRVHTLQAKAGKEEEFENWITAKYDFYDWTNDEWLCFNVMKPEPGRYSFAMSFRNASIIERYMMDERQNIDEGELSSLVVGPPAYDVNWIIDGMVYDKEVGGH
mmetsp:Transcript_80646/g.152361  ORF Transcript_80646/g.152361 Transcript_80646/m.152361 type:complete len:238 (-) Transcript_80646:39-752(-)